MIIQLTNLYHVTTDYLLGIINNPNHKKENKRDIIIITKIVTEFPEVDWMINDLSKMSAADLEEIYDFIKFKSQKNK